MPPEVDGILGLCQGGELDLDAIDDMGNSDDEMEDEFEEGEDEDEDGNDRGDRVKDRLEDYVQGALFANGLYTADKITQNAFSFYLADDK